MWSWILAPSPTNFMGEAEIFKDAEIDILIPRAGKVLRPIPGNRESVPRALQIEIRIVAGKSWKIRGGWRKECDVW